MIESDALLQRLRAADPAQAGDIQEPRVRARVLLRGEQALETGTASRWRGVPRLVAVGAGAVAVALAVALVLAGPSGTERLNVVAEARAALPAPGELVHLRTVQTTSLVDADPAAQRRFEKFAHEHWDEYGPETFEQWSTEGRWRVARPEGTVSPKMFAGEPYAPGFYIPDEELERIGLAEEVVGPTQEAFADGIDSLYVEKAGVLIESNLQQAGWETDVGSFPGGIYTGAPTLLGGDPVSALRDQLDRGNLEDAGTAEVNGRSVRLLVSKDGVFEYAVDAETFEPVRARMLGGWRGEVDSPHPVERMANDTNFEVYEVLTLDAETEPLLEIDVPEGTPVIETIGPADQPPRRER